MVGHTLKSSSIATRPLLVVMHESVRKDNCSDESRWNNRGLLRTLKNIYHGALLRK